MKTTGSPPRRAAKQDARVERGLKTRAALIETAAAHFALHGFEKASLREIAQESKLPFQLITYHFGNKYNLWKASVELLFERAFQEQKFLGVAAAGSPEELLREWIRAKVNSAAANPNLRKILIREHFENTPRYRTVLKPLLKELFARLMAAYESAYAAAGRSPLTVLEMQLIFQAYFAAVSLGPSGMLFTSHTSGSPQQRIDRHTQFLFNVLKSGRGSS